MSQAACMLDWALRYARMGWRVLPLKGKLPATEHGSHDATTDEDRIRKWWASAPRSNIGVATGHTFFALDIDIKNGGDDSFNALIFKHGRLPDTAQQITGTGGQHFLFSLPSFPVHNSGSKVAQGIDIRGIGGYIVVAPSIHPDTKRPYDWDGAAEIEDQPIAPAPDWLLSILRGDNEDRIHAAKPVEAKIPKGKQHSTLVSIAGSMRRRGLETEEIFAALKVVNDNRCAEPGPVENIRRIAESVSRYPVDTKSSVFGALAKAIDPDAPPGKAPKEPDPAAEQMGSENPPPAPEDVSFLPGSSAEKLFPNDIARCIMSDHLFIQTDAGALYEYNGTYWERIPKSKLLGYGLKYDSHQHTKKSRRAEIASYVEDAVLKIEIPWRTLESSEVPCFNGVVNVKSKAIREHRSQDYLEAVVPHSYSADANCDKWLSALDRWFRGDPDAEAKILAIQEFAGYCLLPHARYKKALFLHGESDTGKSQVALVLNELVGAKNRCALSTEQMADERKRAPIVGKMLNSLTELPSDALIQDGGFKQLVSTGDPISIDPKYLAPFEYTPFCKHVICTNNLPHISDLSKATFNRLLLIKFNNVIPAKEQNKAILDVFRKQITGILCWAIEGAARLIEQNGEFTPIGESVEAVKEYREEQNPVNLFIEENCLKDPAGKIPMTDFRDRFGKWIRGIYSPKKVTGMLRAAGYRVDFDKDDKSKTVRCALGIRWNTEGGWRVTIDDRDR